MGYTVLNHSICTDCGLEIAQIYLDTDIDGNDDYAGVGWFHITGPNEVQEQCPMNTTSPNSHNGAATPTSSHKPPASSTPPPTNSPPKSPQ